ncbi:MAG: hypothetical protein DHS20C15_21630 [Planctomycetota bacterium]|nr:MAG: hypothetical protein DHS20C15_21630 [Planctomycetota bacterium]
MTVADSQAPAAHDAPLASTHPTPPRSRLWIVPLIVAALAAVLAWQAWGRAGPSLTVIVEDGHGLGPGDVVKHRGVVVGEILGSQLDSDAQSVRLEVRLAPEAEELARQGSRFWIEHPRLELDGLRGLDTLLGGAYLAVQPGAGPAMRSFVGLSEAPLDEARQPGVDITLEAERRGSLRAGSPVTYRRITVGRVLSVGLASDGRRVEATARVLQPFAELVRENTRFWDTSGVQFELGISGMDLKLDTLESLLRGGVALATPPEGGDIARTGQRFELHASPKQSWLDWQPNVALGSMLLPPGTPRPQPLRARLVWTEGLLWSGTESREAWVLPVVGGALVPATMLQPGKRADEDSAHLELLGDEYALSDLLGERDVSSADGLEYIELPGVTLPNVWPRARQRAPSKPEDCLVLGEPGHAPLVLAAARLVPDDEGWWLDPGLLPPERMHGAPVLARRDGKLIGLLFVDEERARLVPLRVAVP